MWHTHTMEYDSAIKNEILPFVTTWMDQEDTMFTEYVRQKGKLPYDFIWYVKSKQ